MSPLLRTLVVCGLLLILPGVAASGIYKYRNSEGRLVFVDDESKIPAEYRDDVSSISEADGAIITYEPGASEALPVKDDTAPDEFERRSAEKALKKRQTPVTIKGNRVQVPVEVSLGNRTVKLSLLLDTGASRTVFHRNALAGLDLPSGKSYKARVAGGGTVNSKRIKFRKIVVGPFEVEKVYAMVINLQGGKIPYDGMLGMDFLKTHPYQIDFENQLLIWDDVD